MMTRQTDFNSVSGRPAHEYGKDIYYWSNGLKTYGAEFQKYEQGGKYAGGSAIMGERGPELVDSSPGYVYRADETKALFAMAKRGVQSTGSADNKGVEERLDKAIRQLETMNRRMSVMETKARVANA